MNSREIKTRARESLRGKYGLFLLIAFLAIVISACVSEFAIVGVLITGPIAVGLAYVFMSLVREQEVKVENLFYGFKSFVPSFLQELLRCIFTLLWTLLFIIPGIIKAFAYSMTPYILVDNPDMTALEAITASKKMMMGNKGRLFKLFLSFIGWIILSILTGGIGFVFLAPYICAAEAGFYQDLITRNGEEK